MWHIWMSERRIFLIESRKLAMLTLARKLAPGFVLMHWREAFLKQLCIFISFRRAGLVAALVCLPAQFRREYITILFGKHWFCCCCCWTQCGCGRRDFFFVVVTAHRVFFPPLSLLCSAQRSHGSLLCYSCGPARTRVRTSAYSINRREAGARPLLRTTITHWQHNNARS